MNARVIEILDILEYLEKTTYGLEQLIRLKLDVKILDKFLYTLDKKEKELNKELSKIRKNCIHDWEYSGHGHNDDVYVCYECKEMEFR